MIIKRISVNGYKNLKDINLTPDSSLNIFCGENAQGKTNLIEAIWLLSGCKSFRGTRDRDFIGFDTDKSEISVKFVDRQRSQTIDFSVMKDNIKDKKILLNGVKKPLLSKLFGTLKCVIFTPEDLELSKGSPDNRRNFLDLCISQIKPSYISAINKYDLLISQRNALLKEIGMKTSDKSALDVWDYQIAEVGAYISLLRNTYTKKLNSFSARLYYNLTKERESLELAYNSTVYDEIDETADFKGKMTDDYLLKLKNNIDEDVRFGFTGVGVHRDDIISRINGLNSRDFGSQGQQRSVALIMKLAQAQILNDECDDCPVILLDDVLSELDLSRQDFILNELPEMQLFVTCCDPTAVLKHKMGKVFMMENGRMIKEI